MTIVLVVRIIYEDLLCKISFCGWWWWLLGVGFLGGIVAIPPKQVWLLGAPSHKCCNFTERLWKCGRNRHMGGGPRWHQLVRGLLLQWVGKHQSWWKRGVGHQGSGGLGQRKRYFWVYQTLFVGEESNSRVHSFVSKDSKGWWCRKSLGWIFCKSLRIWWRIAQPSPKWVVSSFKWLPVSFCPSPLFPDQWSFPKIPFEGHQRWFWIVLPLSHALEGVRELFGFICGGGGGCLWCRFPYHPCRP